MKALHERWKKRRLAWRAVSVGILFVGAVTLAAGVALAGSSRSTLKIVPPKECGQNIVWKKQDPDGALKSLPKSAQARYGAYPYEVAATPWASFKAKKGPWKIGYVSFPTDNPWKVSLFAQLKKEFAKAKAKGLVAGSLQTYVQPDWSTATPEQQVTAIQQMVRDGVDGILVHALNSIAETPAFDAAGKAGVPIVLISDSAPNSKYAINVFSENVSPPWAGTLDRMNKNGTFSPNKTTNVLFVRGIPGVTVENAFNQAAVADLKACPGAKIVGTVWGKWNAATAKAEVLKFLASHPQPIHAVFQSSAGGGIIQAFQQAGRPVPVMSFGGNTGGDLSWWLANKNTPAMQSSVGAFFGGFQVAYTEFRVLLRVLAGKGLKIRDIHIPAQIATSANIAKFATPGKPVSWIGDIRGPANGWGNNRVLDDYFKIPGSPGGF